MDPLTLQTLRLFLHHFFHRLEKRIEAMTATPSVTSVTKGSKTKAKSADWMLGCYSGNDLYNQSLEDNKEKV